MNKYKTHFFFVQDACVASWLLTLPQEKSYFYSAVVFQLFSRFNIYLAFSIVSHHIHMYMYIYITGT